jgi:hypothetical protein
MRRLIILIVLAVAVYGFIHTKGFSVFDRSTTNHGSEQLLEYAFENRKSTFQVEGEGEVIKILSDDLQGSRHQRFIIRLNSGQTLLISHNIDLAPRISQLRKGDAVFFFGEYEWNHKGGVIHWTHHDPAGRHIAGWIKHQGKKYQ